MSFPRNCVACGNRDSTISYFRLPPESKRRDRWLKKCDVRPPYNVAPGAKICALHFAEDAFSTPKTTTVRRRRLRKDAEPSIIVEVDENEYNNELALKTSTWMPCFICGKIPHCERRSMFRFPGNVEQREEWLKNLGMDKVSLSVKKETRLCSKHFAQSDIFQHPRTNRVMLKSGALPIDVTVCSDDSVEMEVDRPKNLEIPTVKHVEFNFNETTQMCEITKIEILHNEEPPTTSSDELCSSTPFEMDEGQGVPCTQSEKTATVTGETMKPTRIVHSKRKNEEPVYLRTHVKRRSTFKEPKYLGDIRTPHLKTPQRAKRNLSWALNVIEQQRKELHALKKKLRIVRMKCARKRFDVETLLKQISETN